MKKLKQIAKVLLVIIVLLAMTVIGSAAAFYYENYEKDLDEKIINSGDPELVEKIEIEPNFTCLVMGRNAHLTDYIMLAQYNPNTREIALLSIPRDTNVGNKSVDGKINSIYMYKYPEKVVNVVEEITGVEIQHYLVFDAKILRRVVDTIGGVTVDVPIDMNYDDPDQGLYIHLKKGVQTLNGKNAEGFVRFRQNNDGTGYPNGDIGRIAAQQSFIKAMVNQMLKVENLAKVNELLDIVLDGTDTDITLDTVEEYLDDIITFKQDRLRMETLPGTARDAMSPYGYNLSYYFYDKEKTDELVGEMFLGKDENDSTNVGSGDNSGDMQEVTSSDLVVEDGRIRVEILNANAKTSKINDLVQKLNESDCNVVKIGNYNTISNEKSKIITYGKHTAEELETIKKLTNINNVEESLADSTIKFTIIIGPAY